MSKLLINNKQKGPIQVLNIQRNVSTQLAMSYLLKTENVFISEHPRMYSHIIDENLSTCQIFSQEIVFAW